MKYSPWPRSLANRTILILLVGFALVQLLGLLLHTLNQISLERIEQEREMATRAIIIYRHFALTPPAGRAALLSHETLPDGGTIRLSPNPPSLLNTRPLPLAARQIFRASLLAYQLPPGLRPRGVLLRGTGQPPKIIVSFGLPGGGPPTGLPAGSIFGVMHPFLSPLLMPRAKQWLTIAAPLRPPAPWRSPGFATAFLVMTLLGGVMIFWAVHRLLVPVRTLAQAAERLGRDVGNAPALPETGASEIVTAAIAFNTMAARVRRFVEDRTFLLTAIGHDLRTPITRLKLRAEYMEDDEQRVKMLADLDEMEAMVASTLAFGRDVAASEPAARLDLASLLRTILDEAADGEPERAHRLNYAGPEHMTINARALSLKRALTNLVGNALKYGDAARVSLRLLPKNLAQIDIEDDGPGIAAGEMEAVFEPFRRLETSRNRETGGAGLGLAIARNILRAHGGDIVLQNLPGRGLRARATLPV